MFDFNLIEIAAEQVKAGSTLSEALDVAKAQHIYPYMLIHFTLAAKRAEYPWTPVVGED